MPASSAPRRRKTGCLKCRARRVKCDEATPICGHCRSKGTECHYTDFIVHDRRSTASKDIEKARQKGSEGSRNYLALATQDPGSIYDAFQQAQLAILPESTVKSRPFDSPDIVISEEALDLLAHFQTIIAPWNDVMDHKMGFGRQVCRLSLSLELLLNAICALSAKQRSLVKARSFWEPTATRYYSESLGLLIQHLNQPETPHEVVLTATVLLCSYELLTNPGPDYKKHLYGASTLIQTRGVFVDGTDLEKASFWVYARHDVAVAVTHELPTRIPPSQWVAALDRGDNAEDTESHHILWLLARVLELRFSRGSTPDEHRQGLQRLEDEIDQWRGGLPSTSRGVSNGRVSDDGLDALWFCCPAAAAGILYFHMAKLLLLEASLKSHTDLDGESEEFPRLNAGRGGLYDQLYSHARSISSICFSPGVADSVIIVAVNPLFYAARYTPSLSLKARIWALLENIEVRLGFHTKDRVDQLQTEFNAAKT